jgi:hypothetical protein
VIAAFFVVKSQKVVIWVVEEYKIMEDFLGRHAVVKADRFDK